MRIRLGPVSLGLLGFGVPCAVTYAWTYVPPDERNRRVEELYPQEVARQRERNQAIQKLLRQSADDSLDERTRREIEELKRRGAPTQPKPKERREKRD